MTEQNYENDGQANTSNGSSPQHPGPPPGAWGPPPEIQPTQAQAAWSAQNGGQQASGTASQFDISKYLDFSNKSVVWLVLAAGASLLAVIGSFMKWMTITAPLEGTITFTGLDAYGFLTLPNSLVIIVGIAVMLFGGWWSNNRWRGVLVVVGGVPILFFAVVALIGTSEAQAEARGEEVFVSIGGGPYLLLIAGIAITVFGVLTILNDRKHMTSAPATTQHPHNQPGYPTSGPSGQGQQPYNWQGNQPPNPQ